MVSCTASHNVSVTNVNDALCLTKSLLIIPAARSALFLISFLGDISDTVNTVATPNVFHGTGLGSDRAKIKTDRYAEQWSSTGSTTARGSGSNRLGYSDRFDSRISDKRIVVILYKRTRQIF